MAGLLLSFLPAILEFELGLAFAKQVFYHLSHSNNPRNLDVDRKICYIFFTHSPRLLHSSLYPNPPNLSVRLTVSFSIDSPLHWEI
jgi:hypothetical protein